MPAVALSPVVLLSPRCCVALAALCCDGLVRAQETVESTPQFEWANQSTPSLQPAEGHTDSRVTLTGWSGPAPRTGMGIGLALPRMGSLGDGRKPATGLDLGLHWRSADQGQGRVRIGVWQRLGSWSEPVGVASPGAEAVRYNTRLEMQFSAASARGIQFELGGALGLQLNNNERVVLRVSRGKPMVYYRVRF